MRIIFISRLVEFYSENPDSRLAIEIWYNRLKELRAKNLKDLQKAGNATEIIGKNRVVSEIKAGSYRLLASVLPRKQTLYIRWIDTTHAFEKTNVHTIHLESGMTPNPIKPIRTKADYQATVQRIELLVNFNPDPGSELDDELEVLTILVHAYEQVHYPVGIPDPIEAIKFLAAEKGLQQKDLEPYIGPKSRVSEILNRKRYFTLQQINNLHKGLKLPLEVFINDEALNQL